MIFGIRSFDVQIRCSVFRHSVPFGLRSFGIGSLFGLGSNSAFGHSELGPYSALGPIRPSVIRPSVIRPFVFRPLVIRPSVIRRSVFRPYVGESLSFIQLLIDYTRHSHMWALSTANFNPIIVTTLTQSLKR
jgi:hypothetical protein